MLPLKYWIRCQSILHMVYLIRLIQVTLFLVTWYGKLFGTCNFNYELHGPPSVVFGLMIFCTVVLRVIHYAITISFFQVKLNRSATNLLYD
jgi:hypothetical protein